MFSDQRAYWAHPNSNFHKMLQIIAENDGASEAYVARKLFTSQGMAFAYMFEIPLRYMLAEKATWRTIGRLTERGFMVLDILNYGKSVDLKTLESSASKAKEYVEKPKYKQMKIVQLSHEHMLLKTIAMNDSQTLSDIETKMASYHENDRKRYLKKIVHTGLVYLNNNEYSITPEGIEILNEMEDGFKKDMSNSMTDKIRKEFNYLINVKYWHNGRNDDEINYVSGKMMDIFRQYQEYFTADEFIEVISNAFAFEKKIKKAKKNGSTAIINVVILVLKFLEIENFKIKNMDELKNQAFIAKMSI